MEDEGVGTVDLVDALLLSSVGSGVGRGLVLHTLDFGVTQTAGSLDADALLLAGSLILGADVHNAVSINLKGHLNLRNSTGSGCDAIEVEASEGLAVLCHGTLALEDMDLNLGLVVGSGREDLAATGRDRGVGLDEFGHHATQSLNTYRQGHHVKQQHVLHVTGEHTALDSGTHSNNLIGINTLGRSLAEEFLHNLLYSGDTGRTAHEDDLVDVAGVEACIGKRLAAGLDGALNQIVAQLLKLGT